jgi:PIN domain nuclease of toxin-antitoxin system
MRILLDTHTFLYWSIEPDRLPKNLLILLSNPSNQVLLSVVSSWEAQIKIGLGKLVLQESVKTILEREIRINHWEILPIHLAHTWTLEKLPPIHKDLFDRILIAQAIYEKLIIATKDPLILSYEEVKTIWM